MQSCCKQVWGGLVAVATTVLILTPGDAFAQGCPGSGQQSSGPDVIVGTLGQIQSGQEMANYAAASPYEALSVGTTSCNLGNAQLRWDASPSLTHPVIGQNLFRLKQINGAYRFEQVGQSWLKHGFTALQQTACCSNCQSSGTGSRLGIGCSDPYTASRNGGQSSAGPKWAVNATTGAHTHPSGAPGFSGSVARRCRVRMTDLEQATVQLGAVRYYIEGQYISPDDAESGNKNNNASHRQVSVTVTTDGGGNVTAATFGYFGTNPNTETRRQEPGIQAWKNFDSSVTLTNVTTPEDANADPDLTVARVIVGAKATDLGGGQWHYEYAVQNLNSDRSIYSFSIPVDPSVTVTNIGFRDVEYNDGDGESWVNRDGTDWTGTNSGGSVTWACAHTFAQNPNANALRWGTLYNFRFDANVAPTVGNATLVQFKPGAQTLPASTVVPSVPSCACPGDVNGDNLIDGGDIAEFTQMYIGAMGVGNCAQTAPPASGALNSDDVDEFVNLLLSGNGC